jgi:hypothetical protein
MPDTPSDTPADGLFFRRDFLPLSTLLKLQGVLQRLTARWTSSEELGLLGRGQTSQIRPTDIAVQAQFNELGAAIAPPALQWAKQCGFRFPRPPQMQVFPVRMVGDAETPAYQEPHVDSYAGQPRPPICTNVFYARTMGIEGGDLALARQADDITDPIVVTPTANMLVSFAGHRVHWVQPLFAGERLSVVLNFY